VKQRRTTLLVLLLLAVIGWFLQLQETGQQATTVSGTHPDNFVRGMNLAIMDETGRLNYRIKAQYMLHDPDTDNLELDHPTMNITRPDGDIWNIASEKGQIITSDNRLWLLGQVDIRRLDETRPFHVRTSTLLVKPDEQLAETEDAATISSRHFRIDAVGLTADFRRNNLKLHSRVRGTIDVAG
jgi:LPS export ABC transporter protein LptC